MPRPCKTCTSTLRDEIDLQIMQGASFTYLAKWCCDRGLNITDTALRQHANKHIEGYNPKLFSEVKQAPQVDTIANQLPDPTLVDFKEYLNKIDLDIREQFEKDDIKRHLKSLQLSVVENYFRLSAILNQKLTDYAQGKCKFPMEQIKAVRLLFDVYDRAIGLQLFVNHNKAFDVIKQFHGINLAYRDDNDLLVVQDDIDNQIIKINTVDKTVTIENAKI